MNNQANWRCKVLMRFGLAIVIVLALSEAHATSQESWIDEIAPLWKWMPLLLKGFLVDVGISIAAMLIGTAFGAIIGVGQTLFKGIIRIFCLGLTQFFRNAPWLVLLFFCILLIPHQITVFDWVIPFPPWMKGIIGLALPVMGNVSEVVRGGLISIPSAQWEAADALALNKWQTLRIVILPQALKRMLPPWMNVYAVLIMATPLVSIVGVEDSVTVARSVLSAEGNTALLMPVYGLLLILFYAYCAPIARLARFLEVRYAVK